MTDVVERKPKKITKKIREDSIRALIDSYSNGVEFTPSDLDRFIALADPAEPIAGAKKMFNREYPNDIRHMWFLIDGEWQNRSWRKWIYPQDDKQKLKIAMRREIQDDMNAYRFEAMEPCAQCGGAEHLSTDHVDPPFNQIAEDFIKKYGTLEIAPGPPGSGNFLADREMAGKWATYHARRATYQILCRSCNSSKGKKAAW